jgi:beta-galactosidase
MTEVVFPSNGADILLSSMGVEAACEYYTALFTVGDAQSKGIVVGGIGKGLSFLTERRLGKGKIALLGAQPSGTHGSAMLQAIVKHYAQQAGVREACKTSNGTVSVRRENDSEEYVFFINMDGGGGRFFIESGYADALSGNEIQSGWNQIPMYGYIAAKKKKA